MFLLCIDGVVCTEYAVVGLLFSRSVVSYFEGWFAADLTLCYAMPCDAATKYT